MFDSVVGASATCTAPRRCALWMPDLGGRVVQFPTLAATSMWAKTRFPLPTGATDWRGQDTKRIPLASGLSSCLQH